MPCDFVAINPKEGDETIFDCVHKTKQMFENEQMMLANKFASQKIQH